MKKYQILIGIYIAIVMGIMWGCLSFKVSRVYPAYNQLEGIYLCKEIDDSGDLIKALNVKSEFASGNNHIICLIRLKSVEKEIKLRWRWYSPEKKMVRDTDDIIVNKENIYLETVTAYDMLRFNFEGNVEGQWVIVIFINNKLVGKRFFSVKNSGKDKCF